MVKTFSAVRHAEREDNVNVGWHKCEVKNSRNLATDNTPLSEGGRKQADELAKRFAGDHIDHIFASPFDRTVETASRLIGDRGIPIKVEPGLAEALYFCEDPPGYEEIDVLKRLYPLVDTTYEPIFKAPLPAEGFSHDACLPRLRTTVEKIIERYSDADHVVLVSHSASIAAIHKALGARFTYVDLASVSKFVRDPKNPETYRLDYSDDTSHL